MSERDTVSPHSSGADRHKDAGSRARGNPVSRLFGSIALFFRQVAEEMRKVVRPTRKELSTYFTVVIVFVSAVMGFVFLLDLGITWLVKGVFAGQW